MRSTIAGLVAAAALIWSGAVLAADTSTAKIGDPSGTSFVSACGPGQAVVGYAYNSDFTLLAIAVICRAVSADGPSGSAIQTKHVYGFAGGDGQDPLNCPDDMAVQGLEVFLTANLRVHHIKAICHPFAPRIGAFIPATKTSDGDKAATAHKEVSCGSGSFADAIIGTYAGGIYSLGLNCHKPGEDAAATDGTNAKADTGGEKPTEDAGGDNPQDEGAPDANIPDINIQIGPLTLSTGSVNKGHVMVVDQPTTVYRKPDGKQPIKYLDADDKVTVVGCADNGRGWCRIVKPVDGFLWGDDLAQR